MEERTRIERFEDLIAWQKARAKEWKVESAEGKVGRKRWRREKESNGLKI
jgi:hypothetical protein